MHAKDICECGDLREEHPDHTDCKAFALRIPVRGLTLDGDTDDDTWHIDTAYQIKCEADDKKRERVCKHCRFVGQREVFPPTRMLDVYQTVAVVAYAESGNVSMAVCLDCILEAGG